MSPCECPPEKGIAWDRPFADRLPGRTGIACGDVTCEMCAGCCARRLGYFDGAEIGLPESTFEAAAVDRVTMFESGGPCCEMMCANFCLASSISTFPSSDTGMEPRTPLRPLESAMLGAAAADCSLARFVSGTFLHRPFDRRYCSLSSLTSMRSSCSFDRHSWAWLITSVTTSGATSGLMSGRLLSVDS